MADGKGREEFLEWARNNWENMPPEKKARMEATRAAVLANLTPRALGPGEELRWFSSPARDWEMLAGRSGYEILKDGVVIERVVTVMN